tara:strand:- start:119 stop:847 length:729 start_codon:yes stop_codon:yes gene_type:complete
MFLVFSIFLSIFINKKKFKYYFFGISLFILILSFVSIINSETLKKRYGSFIEGIPNPVSLIQQLNVDYPELEMYKDSGDQFFNLPLDHSKKKYDLYPFYTGHSIIYLTSLDLFADNPFIGRGIKSFRNNCITKLYLPNRVCENHPHNFYLDILNDTGIFGLILILLPVLILLINLNKQYVLGENRNDKISNWIYLSIMMCLMVHFFPFKSTGSFFSTFNSTYAFLIIGLALGLNEIKFQKKN